MNKTPLKSSTLDTQNYSLAILTFKNIQVIDYFSHIMHQIILKIDVFATGLKSKICKY